MRILTRYLRREIIAATTLVLCGFLALFIFFDFLAELDKVGHNGYTLKYAVIYVLLTIPSRAYEIFPIAVLVGSLYALTSLAKNSEITVMRTVGISTTKLLLSLMSTGLILATTTFVLGEYIAPPTDRIAQSWRLRGNHSAVPQALKSGLWIRDGELFVNVARTLPDGTLQNISIYDFDKKGTLKNISVASKGEFSSEKGWTLTDVTQTIFEANHIRRQVMPSLHWDSQLTPQIMTAVMLTPERMAITDLYQYVELLSANNQRSGRYGVAFWKKIFYPLISLVMLALALPFCLGNQRSGNVGARVLTGIMLGMLFHLLNSLFSNLGIIQNWPAIVSAGVPSLICLLLAITMLWVVDRR